MSDDASGSIPHEDDSSLGFFGRIARSFRGAPADRTELLNELRAAQEHELLDADALTMIEGVLQVADMQVRNIMIPRSQMVVLERDDDLQTLLKCVVESGHSRFPVFNDSRDEVVGILLAKDLLKPLAERDHDDNSSPLRELLRKAVYVPESKRLNVLLAEFRASRNHMAIVVDEYGNTAGLVTIEDVIEQIVGDIDDEHDNDETEHNILQHKNNRHTVKALTTIEEFNNTFGAKLSDDEFDTIGGLVMQSLGRLPQRDDVVQLGSWEVLVLRADNRRVHLLQVSPVVSKTTSKVAEKVAGKAAKA